jgi:hypothetical protein
VTPNANFLLEGAKSYFEALEAIKAFEGIVYEVCKAVYDQNRRQLVSKIGLKDEECEHYKNDKPEDGFAELGVHQSSRSGHETLYLYLRWVAANDGMPCISAEVYLSFVKKSDRDNYAKVLRKYTAIRSGQDPGCFYLWSSHTLGDVSSFAAALNEQLNNWFTYWPADGRLK